MNCSLSSGQRNNKKLSKGLVPQFKRSKALLANLKMFVIIKVDVVISTSDNFFKNVLLLNIITLCFKVVKEAFNRSIINTYTSSRHRAVVTIQYSRVYTLIHGYYESAKLHLD